MQYLKHITGIIIIAVLSLMIVESPPVDSYITSMKNDAVTAQKQISPLQQKIQQKSPQYLIPAQDAKIDSVWKATPGYNGLAVDIKKSYEKMKKDGKFNEKQLIYRQIPPKVHLEDLAAAPLYRGHPDKPVVSLAINVAWGEEYLPNMLAVLKKHRIHATFFFEGRWVKEHQDLAKMIVESGHEAGNHSYSHPDMAVLSKVRIQEEIEKTNKVLQTVTGVQAKLFAPPSGSFGDHTIKIADDLGMQTILWTVDTIDWRKPAPDELINRVVTKVHPGAIILMHPTKSTSAALDTLIKQLKAKQLKIDTVSQLLDETRIVSAASRD